MAEENELFSGLSKENLQNVERIRDAVGEIQKQFRRVNVQIGEGTTEATRINRVFSSIANAADQVNKLQNEVTSSTKATSDAIKEANKQRNIGTQLQSKIDNLLIDAAKTSGEEAENLKQRAFYLAEARDQAQEMAKAFDKIAEDSASLDKSAGFFNDLSAIVGDIPGLRKLAGPFQDAAKAAKETALNNAKTGESMSTLTAGTKAFGKSVAAAAKKFLPLLIVKTIADIIKFIVSLFKSANEETVSIAKNLGISKDQASILREQLAITASDSGKLFVTTEKIVEAQSKLANELQRGGTFTKENLKAQLMLTSRLGASEETAMKLTARAEAFGKNAYEGVDAINNLNNNLKSSGESTATIGQILGEVAKASGQIAASFGFSNEAIAKGVIQVRKFGLNLSQASNIANSLLDFETSIGNELEAELLLGRQFNFERARTLAATGDIAGATQEVMKQMKGLTAEQRRSPIIMKSLAGAIGLSVDELQDAYMLETDRGRQMEERLKKESQYQDFVRKTTIDLKRQGLAGEDLRARLKELNAEEARRLGIENARLDQLEGNVTLQQAFNESLDKAKDSFSKFANSGALDKLTDLLIDFVDRASQVGFMGALFGRGSSKEMKEAAFSKGVQNYQKTDDKTKGLQMALGTLAANNALTQDNLNKFIQETGADTAKVKEIIDRRSQPGIVGSSQQKQYQSIKLDDFTIQPHPKDTLVMAGGTKLGVDNQPQNNSLAVDMPSIKKDTEKTNQLLEKLIAAVERGGNVYMDSNKVGRSLVLGTYQSS